MPDTSAPPSFYNQLAASSTGAGAAPPSGQPGAPQKGADDTEAVTAVAKVFTVLKKLGGRKEGSQPYIERAMKPLKELLVDVYKQDPSSIDNGSDSGSGSSTPDSASATPPPAGDASSQTAAQPA